MHTHIDIQEQFNISQSTYQLFFGGDIGGNWRTQRKLTEEKEYVEKRTQVTQRNTKRHTPTETDTN